jgi:hypothetical protein
MDVTKLSREVIESVRQQLGCEEPDDDSRDQEIAMLEPWDVLDRYLSWNGIIGYGNEIWDAVESIREAAGEESAE